MYKFIEETLAFISTIMVISGMINTLNVFCYFMMFGMQKITYNNINGNSVDMVDLAAEAIAKIAVGVMTYHAVSNFPSKKPDSRLELATF